MTARPPCVVVGCGRESFARYLRGPLCDVHRPVNPSPPPGTTARERREAARGARAADLAERRSVVPRHRRAEWGTTCTHEDCGNPARHAHGVPPTRGPSPCTPTCPCRKAPDLWRNR